MSFKIKNRLLYSKIAHNTDFFLRLNYDYYLTKLVAL